MDNGKNMLDTSNKNNSLSVY